MTLRKNEQARTAKITPHASAVNAAASEWRIPRTWKTRGSSQLLTHSRGIWDAVGVHWNIG